MDNPAQEKRQRAEHIGDTPVKGVIAKLRARGLLGDAIEVMFGRMLFGLQEVPLTPTEAGRVRKGALATMISEVAHYLGVRYDIVTSESDGLDPAGWKWAADVTPHDEYRTPRLVYVDSDTAPKHRRWTPQCRPMCGIPRNTIQRDAVTDILSILGFQKRKKFEVEGYSLTPSVVDFGEKLLKTSLREVNRYTITVKKIITDFSNLRYLHIQLRQHLKLSKRSIGYVSKHELGAIYAHGVIDIRIYLKPLDMYIALVQQQIGQKVDTRTSAMQVIMNARFIGHTYPLVFGTWPFGSSDIIRFIHDYIADVPLFERWTALLSEQVRKTVVTSNRVTMCRDALSRVIAGRVDAIQPYTSVLLEAVQRHMERDMRLYIVPAECIWFHSYTTGRTYGPFAMLMGTCAVGAARPALTQFRDQHGTAETPWPDDLVALHFLRNFCSAETQLELADLVGK